MQDLEEEADEQIADLKVRMEQAAQLDNKARDEGRAAINKVKLLPQVVTMLNRNNIQHAILDPETNFLQAVKFFLEPLNDSSLPAYNIQREIFTALTRLPIEKEALLSSGIGKIVLFYTRTKRAQPEIKRMAERLMGEWSRPILKRTDDFKKRHIDSRDFDSSYVTPKRFLRPHPWLTCSTVSSSSPKASSLTVHPQIRCRWPSKELQPSERERSHLSILIRTELGPSACLLPTRWHHAARSIPARLRVPTTGLLVRPVSRLSGR